MFLLVVLQRTCGRVAFGINARLSYACTGGMLAIACCCAVAYVYYGAVSLWVSCCRTGLVYVYRGSYVSYVQSSYIARGLEPYLVHARCLAVVSIVTLASILLCESLAARKTERWTALGVLCGCLDICCYLCVRWHL